MSRKTIRSARKIEAPKEVKNSMRVLNLSGYEIPSIKENTRNDWVEYGDNNDYFTELIERYLGSPTNSRCINGIVDMVYGRGLNATDSTEKPEMFGKMQSVLRPGS